MNIMGIILPIAAFLIAGLLVAALWLWWGGGESPKSATPEIGVSTPPPPTSPEGDALENLKDNLAEARGFQVLPSSQPDTVLIEVDGKTYTHIHEITDAAVKNQIRLQIQALHQFVGEAQEYKPPTTIAPAADVAPPPKKMEGPPPANTIAEQIEAVLQEHLLTLPHLHARSIHILNALDGGVQIKVDETYYESVNDVQDNEIRSLLQAAIQEWELRTQLG